jgi:hypothetical protein
VYKYAVPQFQSPYLYSTITLSNSFVVSNPKPTVVTIFVYISIMRFTILPLLASTIISSVLATPITLAQRDTSVIEQSMKKVTSSLQKLVVEVHSLSMKRDQNDIVRQEQRIDAKANEVIKILQDEGRIIKSKAPIVGTIEALRLTEGISSLQSATKSVMDAWIEAKPTVLRLNGKANVLSILQRSEVATNDFVDAMVSKLPAVDRAVGQLAGMRSKEMLRRAIETYIRS